MDIETTHIPFLRKQFSQGSPILFLGAGFSLGALNTQGHPIPSVWALIEKLWEICYPGEPVEAGTQLQDIFDTALKRQKREITSLFQSEFSASRKNIPDWYFDFLSMPWLKVYTLNVDNLVETVLIESSSLRRSNRVSAIGISSMPQLAENRLDIIHINGDIDDDVSEVTFSRRQYALRGHSETVYKTLSAELVTSPVVFVGSNLEELSFWEHLELRGSDSKKRAENELRPRSYLVTPKLAKAKIALLESYNITWLPMTAEQFNVEVLSACSDIREEGLRKLNERASVYSAAQQTLQTVEMLSSGSNNDSEYLLGEQVVWSDVQRGKVAHRGCFNDALEQLNAIRASSDRRQIFVITGTAASGKSSLQMWLAMRLSGEGNVVAWVDAENRVNTDLLVSEVVKMKPETLFISDADIYGAALSRVLREIKDESPSINIVLELRSTKVDKALKQVDLHGIEKTEFSIPHLADSDIYSLLDVLEKFNRLGVLKGVDKQLQFDKFKGLANRQLLPAMYEATSGKKFEDRAKDELKELEPQQKFVYGLACTAAAYRFSLSKDEIVVGIGDNTNSALNSIEMLIRRKLLRATGNTNRLSSRHRVIGQMVYDELVESGSIEPIIRGIIALAATKVAESMERNARPVRMLKVFLNHDLVGRTIGVDKGRGLYEEFESLLSWDAHYWLHRGALEIDAEKLDTAENFLNQAMNIADNDSFIQTEWAFLQYKLANADPSSFNSAERVAQAQTILEGVIATQKNLSAHAYHILIQQGTYWAKTGAMGDDESKYLLNSLLKKARVAIELHPDDEYLAASMRSLHKEILLPQKSSN